MTKDAENARKAALLERAKARKRAKEQAERTGASPLPAASSAARRDPAQQHADATRLERALTDKSAEATRWRQAAAALREEKNSLESEVARLGRANEQLTEHLSRSQLDGDAMQEEVTQREREARRADKYRRLAEERQDLVRRAEQREAAANAAAAKCRREAEASSAAADAAQNQLKMMSSAARGDEAIAAAEVLILRGEIESMAKREATAQQALQEQVQECAALKASHQQLQLSNATLQERLITLEEDAAAQQREQGIGSMHGGSLDRLAEGDRPSAQMYARLSSSSHWAARQMGAIEGCLTKLGVGELAELFSFVWVAAATATEADGSHLETQRAVEEAVVNAERYVNAAIRKREEEHAAAVSRALALAAAGQQADGADATQMTGAGELNPAAFTAVTETFREAARALACGFEDMAKCDSIPGPIKAVKLRLRLLRPSHADAAAIVAEDPHFQHMERLGVLGAVDKLSSVIQASLVAHASALTSLRQAVSQGGPPPTKLEQSSGSTDETVMKLCHDLQAARRETSNSETAYSLEVEAHSATKQELKLLANQNRTLQDSHSTYAKTQTELVDLKSAVYRLYSGACGHIRSDDISKPEVASVGQLSAVEDRVRSLEAMISRRESDAHTLALANDKQTAELAKLTNLLRAVDTELKCVTTELSRAASEKANLAEQLRQAQDHEKELEASAARANADSTETALTGRQLELMEDLQATVRQKNEALAKSVAQNKELVYMLSWLEQRYELLSKEHSQQLENEQAFKRDVTSRQVELSKLRALLAKQRGDSTKTTGRRRDFR